MAENPQELKLKNCTYILTDDPNMALKGSS
jgi:hypothetical protein